MTGAPPYVGLLPPAKGKTASRHRMRCSHCGGRFTLKRHPDKYVRAIRCPHCRSLNVYSCEQARRRELRRQETCHCSAYPFPHRAGSMTFCRENPQWDDPAFVPSRDDELAYDRVIATPRSGCM